MMLYNTADAARERKRIWRVKPKWAFISGKRSTMSRPSGLSRRSLSPGNQAGIWRVGAWYEEVMSFSYAALRSALIRNYDIDEPNFALRSDRECYGRRAYFMALCFDDNSARNDTSVEKIDSASFRCRFRPGHEHQSRIVTGAAAFA